MNVIDIQGYLKRVEVADVEIGGEKTKGVILHISDWNDPYVPSVQLRLVLTDVADWAELRLRLADL